MGQNNSKLSKKGGKGGREEEQKVYEPLPPIPEHGKEEGAKKEEKVLPSSEPPQPTPGVPTQKGVVRNNLAVIYGFTDPQPQAKKQVLETPQGTKKEEKVPSSSSLSQPTSVTPAGTQQQQQQQNPYLMNVQTPGDSDEDEPEEEPKEEVRKDERVLALNKLSGQGCAVDVDGALKLLQECVKDKNAEAMWMLGICYEYGIGVERDLKKAESLYQQSGDNESVIGSYFAQHGVWERGSGMLNVRSLL